MSGLGQFSAGATSESVRGCLLAYYRMHDAAVQLREDSTAAGASLRERIALAGVIADIEAGIASARRWLSRRARRGLLVAAGHGDASPALADSLLALHSDHLGNTTTAGALPADPLLLGLRGQELPERGTLDHTQTHEGLEGHG